MPDLIIKNILEHGLLDLEMHVHARYFVSSEGGLGRFKSTAVDW